MTPRPMTALDAADDQLARALGTIRERAGDDRDVVWLAEAIERRVGAVRKMLGQNNRGGKSERQAAALAKRKKSRGGKSARWAAALAQRNNQRLRPLHAKLYPTLPPGAAALLMCTNFRRYESDRWPRERDYPVAPLDEPARTFWMILRDHEAGGPKMPGWRQLATILGRQGG
jgi:hypothetical protein